MPPDNTSRRGYGLPSNPRAGPRLVKQGDVQPSRQSTPRRQSPNEVPQLVAQDQSDVMRGVDDKRQLSVEEARSPQSSSQSSTVSPNTRRKWTGYSSSTTSVDVEESQPAAYEDQGTEMRVKGTEEVRPLWNKVADIASNLTINVGKAWASGIATEEGEDTPVGAESRLTRAMKSYYIGKAREHKDLPDWLFNERERDGRKGYSQEIRGSSSDRLKVLREKKRRLN